MSWGPQTPVVQELLHVRAGGMCRASNNLDQGPYAQFVETDQRKQTVRTSKVSRVEESGG